MCVMMISPGICFIFVKFFWLLGERGGGGGGERAKIAQNKKYQLYLSHAISQEQYSI